MRRGAASWALRISAEATFTWRLGDSDRALVDYKVGLDIARDLAVAFPAQATWQMGLAAAHQNAANALLMSRQAEPAREHYRTASVILDALCTADPGNAVLQEHLRRLGSSGAAAAGMP
jgi:hypothetical protein